MSAGTVVFGSWQLRHSEPAEAEGGRIELARLRNVDLRARSLVLDARDLDRHELLSPHRLPLAVLAGEDEEAPIAYLVHGLEATRALFVRVEERSAGPMPLPQRISSLFEEWHLRLSNNECYYVSGEPAEWVRRVAGDASYRRLGWALHERLDEDGFGAFIPQFRVPPRAWHVDVEAFALAAAGREGERLALAQRHARRRSSWDQSLFTVETFVIDDNGGCRRVRRGEIDLGASGHGAAVADFAGAPAHPLAAWRRLAVEVPCESLDTGNVFTLAVEDCQPVSDEPRRRVLARVRYEKTRGHGDARRMTDDLVDLSRCVTECLNGEQATLVEGRDMLAAAAVAQRIQA